MVKVAKKYKKLGQVKDLSPIFGYN